MIFPPTSRRQQRRRGFALLVLFGAQLVSIYAVQHTPAIWAKVVLVVVTVSLAGIQLRWLRRDIQEGDAWIRIGRHENDARMKMRIER